MLRGWAYESAPFPSLHFPRGILGKDTVLPGEVVDQAWPVTP